MPLEILLEQQINVTYLNEASLEDVLEPSRLIYGIEPVITIRRKLWRSHIPRSPTFEGIDDFYEIDKEGLYLVAHRNTKLKNGQVISKEVLSYAIFQHISLSQVQEIERCSEEGLSYPCSVKTFLLGDAHIENPAILLLNIASRLREQPTAPNGYLLILMYAKGEGYIGITPYKPSLIEQLRQHYSEFHKKIHAEMSKGIKNKN